MKFSLFITNFVLTLTLQCLDCTYNLHPSSALLLPSDIQNIKVSWSELRKNPEETGAAILTNLFKKYPEYLELFPFRGTRVVDLAKKPSFKAHCVSVVYAISSIVDNLYNFDVVAELAKKLGRSHRNFNVPSAAIWHLKDILLEIFKANFSWQVVNSWMKLITTAFSIISSYLF